MARATLVCCVLSVFVSLLLFFFFFFVVVFIFFFFLGGGCFVLLLLFFGLFVCCFFLVSAIDALDLVCNIRNSEQTEYVHIRERGAANRV